MLELQILAANVVLPVGVMLAGLALMRCFPQPTTEADGERFEVSRSALTLLLIAGVASIWLAFGVRLDFAWWPEDAWARIPQAVAMVGIGSLCSIWLSTKPHSAKWLAGILNACFLATAAVAVFPTGEAWEFLLPNKYIWIGLLIASPWFAWWFAEQFSGSRASVLGFGWIFCIAAAAVLASDFLKITEPLLAVASVVGCTSLACLKRKHDRCVATVAAPMIFGMSAVVANAQFNSYANLPNALFWFAITAPSLAALLAWPALRSSPDKALGWKRVAIVFAICLTLAIFVVAWKVFVTDSSSGEEWS